MESLPPALLDFISMFRPLLRTEVFDSFTYLLCGLLIGEAKHGTVRASVFAPAHYQPQRLSDLFCCHKLSRQALMAQLTQGVLTGAFPFSRSCCQKRERGISHLFQHVPASGFVEGAEHEYFLCIFLVPKDTRPFEA